MEKPIYITLRPRDFEYSDFDCAVHNPLTRAMRRKYKENQLYVGVGGLTIDQVAYEIKDRFTEQDYKFVKREYAKDKGRTTLYYVTLVPKPELTFEDIWSTR